jgi:FkbM family methyltransferase
MCNFHEVFVDAGAYVGDTVERFIWGNMGEFRHIHAFEPGRRQFRALERRVARLVEEWALDPASISLMHAGLSDVDGEGDISDTGMASRIEQSQGGAESIKVMTLDRYLDGRPVDFIKSDVEGMDLELLRGAQQTIRTFKPKMALAAYHHPDHLFKIAEYVRDLVPEYKFYLRLHAYLLGEFVLYCAV